MKKRKLVAILSALMLFSGCNFKENELNLNNKSTKYSIKEDETNVLDYVDVLKTYYNLAIGDNDNPTKTFDQFYDSYYSESSDRNLYNFTLELAEENNNYTDVFSTLFKNSEDEINPASSSGGSGGGSTLDDADYILKDSTDYSYTPQSAFAKQPYYSVYDYSAVKNGDIVWETETIFFNAGHNALITNIQHSSAYGSYIETIEAVGGGVQRGFLDDLRMTYYKCKILRVVGRADTNANNAIFFAKRQIGKKYSLNTLRLNTSIDSTEWYCSELVYACWKYAGIDIGVKKEGNKDVYLSLGCLPSDINNSYNTYIISTYYDFLSFGISAKDGNAWKVRIYNNSSVRLTVEYNNKMCYLNDAKEWKNLSDILRVTIESESSVLVNIYENWFATSITASFIKGNYRIITYANKLSTSGLSSYNNIIENKTEK